MVTKSANYATLASENNADEAETRIGSYQYMAPEIIQGKGGYSKEVDTYSLGALLYYLIFLESYQEKGQGREFVYKNLNEINSNRWISEDLKYILKQMLKIDTKRRITLENVMNEKVIKDAITKLK